jgi:hypothetical protein
MQWFLILSALVGAILILALIYLSRDWTMESFCIFLFSVAVVAGFGALGFIIPGAGGGGGGCGSSCGGGCGGGD